MIAVARGNSGTLSRQTPPPQTAPSSSSAAPPAADPGGKPSLISKESLDLLGKVDPGASGDEANHGEFPGADARAKREAGADLVQVYTGLIYRGPALVPECARALRQAATPSRR